MRKIYTIEDLRNWPVVTADEPVPLRLAVLGDPVAHSASPQMHNAALAECGIAARYCRLHIRPEEFSDALRMLASKGFIGVNCTIPHKVSALNRVDRVDEHARRIGVVNTVVIENGKLIGYNTDGPGLVSAVREEFGRELREQRIMVIGAAGGAGRAISMQCAIEGCPRLVLVNRRRGKAGTLQGELTSLFPGFPRRVRVGFWTSRSFTKELAETDLVINCSALGMKPDDASPIPAELLSSRHLLFDTIYTAARTPLMRAADAAGARSANGLSMLLHQGALSFEHWFHRPAPLEIMRAALTAHAASVS